MWTDVKRYVKSCVKCQTLKSENRKPAGKLQPITTLRPNEILGVDIMGPLPESSKQHAFLLVFVDYFFRWVELFPMRHATAPAIAEILRKEVLDYILCLTIFCQIEEHSLSRHCSLNCVENGV